MLIGATITVRIMAARGLTVCTSDLAFAVGVGVVAGTASFVAGVVFFSEPAATLVTGAAVTTMFMLGVAVGNVDTHNGGGGADCRR